MTAKEHREKLFRTLAYTCWTVAIIGFSGFIFRPDKIFHPIIIASIPMAFLGGVFSLLTVSPQKQEPTDSASDPR